MGENLEFQRLVSAIIRKFWAIALCAICGAVLLGGYSYANSYPIYQTETTLYIMKQNNSLLSGDSINLQDITLSRELIKDYGYIVLSKKVLDPAIQSLNSIGINATDISSAISVNLKRESNVMSIVVRWHNPLEAREISNAVSRSFITEIRQLANTNTVGILDEAQVPLYPVPENHLKKAVVGFMAGALISLAIIYVRELFDSTIRSASDIEKGLGLKIVGIIPGHNIT